MAEPEAAPYALPDKASAARVDAAIHALIAGRPAASPWTLNSDALKLAGLKSGDILIVDLGAQPVAGKVVCAQVYAWSQGTAETVFRIYEPPYLVAASDDPALRRPHLVDNNVVVIKGVVTDVIRAKLA